MPAAQWNWCSVENLDRLKIWNTSFIVPLTAAVWQKFVDIVPLWAPEWTESVKQEMETKFLILFKIKAYHARREFLFCKEKIFYVLQTSFCCFVKRGGTSSHQIKLWFEENLCFLCSCYRPAFHADFCWIIQNFPLGIKQILFFFNLFFFFWGGGYNVIDSAEKEFFFLIVIFRSLTVYPDFFHIAALTLYLNQVSDVLKTFIPLWYDEPPPKWNLIFFDVFLCRWYGAAVNWNGTVPYI